MAEAAVDGRHDRIENDDKLNPAMIEEEEGRDPLGILPEEVMFRRPQSR